MKNQRLWLTVAALLAFIWSGVAVVMHLTDDYVSWPEKVIDLMAAAPWLEGKSTQPRQPYIDEIIANLNRLDFQQSRRLREDAQDLINRFFASLTPEEQKVYVDRTLDRHFDTISRGLKLMAPEERKRLVGRLRTDMRAFRNNAKDQDEERLSKQDQEFFDLMIEEDPILFLRGLPTKAKMEIAPAIEGMVSKLQGPGRR
jgi:hypothetical protein